MRDWARALSAVAFTALLRRQYRHAGRHLRFVRNGRVPALSTFSVLQTVMAFTAIHGAKRIARLDRFMQLRSGAGAGVKPASPRPARLLAARSRAPTTGAADRRSAQPPAAGARARGISLRLGVRHRVVPVPAMVFDPKAPARPRFEHHFEVAQVDFQLNAGGLVGRQNMRPAHEIERALVVQIRVFVMLILDRPIHQHHTRRVGDAMVGECLWSASCQHADRMPIVWKARLRLRPSLSRIWKSRLRVHQLAVRASLSNRNSTSARW
jgi:hypothetical protein